jgi:hypothetical protein
MKRSLSILLIASFITGLVMADNVTGKLTPAGKFEFSLGTGSQTTAFERTYKNFDQFTITNLGVKYGINKDWDVALNSSGVSPIILQSYQGTGANVSKAFSFQGPLTISGEYNTGVIYGLDTKAILAYDLTGFTTTIKKKYVAGASDDQSVVAKNLAIGMAASKTGLYDSKLTLGASVAVIMTTVAVDSDIETMFNDQPGRALAIKLGADYMINNMASVYLNLGKVYDSTAVGAYDDDTTYAIITDQSGSVELGVKVLY